MQETAKRQLFAVLVVWALLQTGAQIAQSFVNYPAWRAIGSDTFAAYHHEVAVLAGLVLFAPRVIEVLLTLVVMRYRPASVPSWVLPLGLTLVAGALVSTMVVQRPVHVQLETVGNTPELLARLRATDLVRHVLGWLRAIIYIGVLLKMLSLSSVAKETASPSKLQGAA